MNRKALLACCAFVGVIVAVGCRADEPGVVEVVEEEIPARVETRWTTDYEWFVEHPLLIQGEPAAFAAHLTELTDFRAVVTGRLEVALLDGSGTELQRVVATEVLRAGIFAPELTPESAGEGRLVLTYHAPDGTRDEVAWDVRVAAAANELVEPTAEPEAIAFLKEQQWRIPFATVDVQPTTLRDSVVLAAVIESHERFTAAVAPPGPGLYEPPESGLPGPGTQVQAGQKLGHLRPLPGVGGDWSSLAAELVSVRNAATEAEHEYARAERLVAAGAVPGRRLVEARSTMENTNARLAAVEARVAVLNRFGGEVAGSRALTLVAPISGVVSMVAVSNGEPVDADSVLFRIIDLENLVLRVEVPERDLTRLLAARAAREPIQIRLRPGAVRGSAEGSGAWINAGQLLDRGTQIDPATRTASMRYELQGLGSRLLPGMSAEAQVLIGDAKQALTVPASAVIDLAGVSVVYVQLGGENFEERVVRTGAVNGDLVEILAGLAPGDRVVTAGAYQVRLAALSPDAAPAHSH